MKRPIGNPTALREAMLEVMTEAALSGHNLTPFDPVESRGYQSRCRRCQRTVWVGNNGLLYSLLEEQCGTDK